MLQANIVKDTMDEKVRILEAQLKAKDQDIVNLQKSLLKEQQMNSCNKNASSQLDADLSRILDL